MEQRPHEANSHSGSQQIFSLLFTTARHWSVLSQTNPVKCLRTSPHLLTLCPSINSNIILLDIPMSSEW